MVETLCSEWGVDKLLGKMLVESFFEEIRCSLERGEQVKLSGFGNFDLLDKNPRPGATPKPARKCRYLHVGWSYFDQVKNSRSVSLTFPYQWGRFANDQIDLFRSGREQTNPIASIRVSIYHLNSVSWFTAPLRHFVVSRVR